MRPQWFQMELQAAHHPRIPPADHRGGEHTHRQAAAGRSEDVCRFAEENWRKRCEGQHSDIAGPASSGSFEGRVLLFSFTVKYHRLFVPQDGQPGNGGLDSSGEQTAGRLLCHRSKCQPGPASDRRGRWAKCGEKLGIRELRREVSDIWCATLHARWLITFNASFIRIALPHTGITRYYMRCTGFILFCCMHS